MKATIQWLGDKRFVGHSEYVEGEHSLIMDAPTQFGGKNSAPSPMEVVLAAAGTCASMDVTSILTQARQDIHDCKVSLTSERSKTPPTVFTAIHMHFDIYLSFTTPIDIFLKPVVKGLIRYSGILFCHLFNTSSKA
ncbi:OsmC family protein [Endozoicomonas atrinae]|uniref:OsmC family protein n=1 Tax=Endozoicomonas atrinae TaxID=1333660 RepID=UPI003B00F59A